MRHKQKPNILFLFSDQHGAKYTSYNNHDIVSTPNLDKLAAHGTSFNNCYTQNPLCVPGRACMLAGQYSKNIGIYDNKHIMQANSTTLPRTLSENGYRTCVIGKTHFNGEQFHGYQQRPYGDLYGQAHQPDPKRNKDSTGSVLGGVIDNTGPTEIPLALTQTEICVSETAKWLQQHVGLHKAQPFFLSVNFDKPHFPMKAPKKYYDKYIDLVAMPEYDSDYLNQKAVPFVKKAAEINGAYHHYNKNEDVHKKAIASYFACIEWVDDAIGRILDVLEHLELADNTIVIYSSDHGEMACERGFWQKTVFFDSSAKVPLLIKMPNSAKAQASDEIVGLVDLFSTLCDATQIDIPSSCDGASLLPILAGGKIVRDGIFSESVVLTKPEHAGCMLRDKQYKFNYYLDKKHELYDMLNDAKELNNLYGNEDYKEISDVMIKKIEDFWQPEKQLDRYNSTPMMDYQKDKYFYSNQFITGDGVVFDARP